MVFKKDFREPQEYAGLGFGYIIGLEGPWQACSDHIPTVLFGVPVWGSR